MKKYLSLFLFFMLISADTASAVQPSGSMVVSAHPLATQAGLQVLKQGGNAFDAAAATALALGVVEPGSSGMGGGGFFLLYIAKEKRYVMLDARETSPALAGHGEIYQEHSSINGPQSAGVPGLIAGVDDLIKTYGRLPRRQSTQPAIMLASDGFPISPRLQRMIQWRAKVLNPAALPSSGGITMAEIFGMLKDVNFSAMSRLERIHLIIETMKRAYRDRNHYLGDRDFVRVPDLLSAKRLERLRASIDESRATPAEDLQGFAEPIGASVDTTHFSVVDDEGNMVSATLSINYGMGSGYVSPSTGILLNDEMDDFATQPGKPNAYGLVQGKANAVAPGKRMLSSMSPTFVVNKDRTFVVGTPGGSRIISMVMLASLAFVLNETEADTWVNAPRFHHQFLPDEVQYEAGAFTDDELRALRARGHHLKEVRRYGNMQAIVWQHSSGNLKAISDVRGEGRGVFLPSVTKPAEKP